MGKLAARRTALALALAAADLSAAGLAQAALNDPAFSESTLLPNIGAAGTTVMAWVPDGSNRLLYARQSGAIYLVANGKPSVFASLPAYGTSECGLLGLAFDPNFVVNHYLYAFVTVSGSEQQIVRFTADELAARDPKVIVAGLPTRGANHNAGSIGFGPDGKLYWAIGDLGNHVGSYKDLLSLASKVSRANVDGSAPADNPFNDGDGPNDDRIWASGFRNPFTFTWNPRSDRLWVNSVGNTYEQIFTPQAGDNAGWPDYEANQPPDYLSPILTYPTAAPAAFVIAAGGAARSAGVASFSTTLPNTLRVGARVTIGGVTDPSFDGTGFVTAVSSPQTFAFNQPGPDAVSGGGYAAPIDLGQCITGGAFWDSSSVPESYRNNYFFGDYLTAQIGRVTFGNDDEISSFDSFGTAAGSMIDMAVGPDGDMYYATFQGQVQRIRYNAQAQGIVASSLHVRVPETGEAVFSVRLAMAPSGPVTVAIARSAGDDDVTPVTTELTFDATNWSTPQPVHVTAAADADAADDVAELELSAAGIPSEQVEIRVTDSDPIAIELTPAKFSVAAEASADVSVVLNGRPSAPVSVDIEPPADALLEVSSNALVFGRDDWSKPQTVTFTAHGAGPFPIRETVAFSARLLLGATLRVSIVAPEMPGAGGASAPSDETGGAPNAAGAPSIAGAPGAAGAEGAKADAGAEGVGGQSQTAGGAPPVEAGPAHDGCGCRLVSGQGSRSSNWLVLGAFVGARRLRRSRPAKASPTRSRGAAR